jgi:ParB family transcriptional regulator, chromosome partitioning protein
MSTNNNSTKRNALGKGLTALLQDAKTDVSGKNPVPVNAIAEINLNEVEANPFQPRLEFDEAALEELSESIKLHGIIQPITVRKVGYGKYELISGERRTRAAIRAGLKTIPAYVRLANDQGMLEMALIENIHRENLNSIEIALSYQRLLEECKLKHEELSDRVGKNRSTVTNYLRLLRLPEEIQIALRDNQITMGHARPLINVDSKDLQLEILDEIIDNELSVRRVEELVKEKISGPKPKKEKAVVKADENFQVWEQKLSKLYDAKVKVKLKKDGKGELVIPFSSEADLKKIAQQLEKHL